MDLTDVVAALDALEVAECRVWVAGGWGVDALVGRQTRAHRDLDLAFDASRESEVLGALGRLGYAVETDWRPVRVELVAPGQRWVDLHPVTFDTDGDGVQAGLDGRVFTYPASVLVEGRLAGRVVACLSAAKQLEFHRGYPPRAADLQDIALLEPLTDA